MTDPTPDKGPMSYSCVFYAHQFCDGTTPHAPEGAPIPTSTWIPCACPCHGDQVKVG